MAKVRSVDQSRSSATSSDPGNAWASRSIGVSTVSGGASVSSSGSNGSSSVATEADASAGVPSAAADGSELAAAPGEVDEATAGDASRDGV